MHDIYALKEMAIEELENFGRRGEISIKDLPTIDTLAHAAKNLCKIIEMCEEKTGYSYGGRMNVRGNYSSRGRGMNARRDSMGRYSGDDDWMVETLHELMHKAPNEQMKMEFQEFIDRVERTK